MLTFAFAFLAFNIENSDDVIGKGYSAPPSRPPSRMMNTAEMVNDVKNSGTGAPSSGTGPF